MYQHAMYIAWIEPILTNHLGQFPASHSMFTENSYLPSDIQLQEMHPEVTVEYNS